MKLILDISEDAASMIRSSYYKHGAILLADVDDQLTHDMGPGNVMLVEIEALSVEGTIVTD